MYDVLIRNGTLVDGTGASPHVADVAIKDGTIVAVKPNMEGEAREEIDAGGKLVTPGFIDIHTHYDGQVTWDDAMLPSAQHGVTTALIGLCGIGFAPVRKGREDWLISLTEGVEDIPGTALHVGIPWGWESYTEYLDALDKRHYALNIASHVPHSAVRAYVIGDRAEKDEPATDEELSQIASIVREGIRAGAVGVGTSRIAMHRGSDGSVIPGTNAPEDELVAIAEAIREGGGGVFQMIPSGTIGGVEGQEGFSVLADLTDKRDRFLLTDEIKMMRRIHQKTGVPITFTFTESHSLGKEQYDGVRALIDEAANAGERIFPQYSPRQIGALSTLESYHGFMARPSYKAIAHLPVEEQARRMADPALKAAILSEKDDITDSEDPMQHIHVSMRKNLADTYDLGPDLDFEPDPSRSIKARAEAEQRDPLDLLYDLLIADDGHRVVFWLSTNYVDGNFAKVEELIHRPDYLIGLGDAGAHVCFICDASYPTYTLSHWGRKRTRGARIPIELLVQRLTGDPARVYGLEDRGTVEVGKSADLNVIDWEKLWLGPPQLVADLPTGAKRFLQQTKGYALTMVNGVITRRNDEDTGERPGHLLRKRHHPSAPPLAEVELAAALA